MKLAAGFVLFLLLIMQNGICQQTELKGHAEQFAGEALVIRKITNPISGNSKVVDTLRIENSGSFQQQIRINQAGWVFINTGIYRVTILLRPGYGYEILLPPKTEKTESDIRNPFFKPVFLHMQIKSKYPLHDPCITMQDNDINTRIFRFDSLMAESNYQMVEAMRNHLAVDPDSIIDSIEQIYKYDNDKYFKDYRKFRYGLLRINSRDVGLQYIYEKYLWTDISQTGNPAWYELFDEMYSEFLFFYSRTEEGKSIQYLVNRKQDLHALKDTLIKHPAVPNRSLAELIIIKEIFDNYTTDYFHPEALLVLLDSIIADPEKENHARYAKEVKEYITRLNIGQPPPDFRLLNKEKEYTTLDDFRGKYVYLNFCTPDNYSCLKEFPFIKALHEAHKKNLAIVTILVTEEIENMIDFMKKNRYDWQALFYGNDEKILQDYKVRAFPTCYLIGPKGKLLQSPAALATEGLEQQLFKIMRARGDL